MDIHKLIYISHHLIIDITLIKTNILTKINYDTNLIFLPNYKINSLQYIPEYRKVITLVTDNQNIIKIEDTLNSIRNQLIKPDKIYLIISKTQYKLLLNVEIIKTDCQIIVTDNYYFPLLSYEDIAKTIIIKVHSGVLYPNTLLKSYITVFKKKANYMYALSIYKYKSINYFQPIILNNKLGDNYHSEYSIAFLRDFFKSDFNSYNSLVKFNINKPDNILLLNYFKKYKINLKCVNLKKCGYLQITNNLNRHVLDTNIIKHFYNDILKLKHFGLLYLINYSNLIDYARLCL